MDHELISFVAQRVSEQELAARHAAQNWVEGNGSTPEHLRNLSIARRGFLEVADDLSARTDPSVAALGDRLLRFVALLYSDHPDYRPEWHPARV